MSTIQTIHKDSVQCPIKISEFDIVIYHSNCPDGFTSAWAFWLWLNNTCDYIPYRYGMSPPNVEGKNVAVVDFSFSREDTVSMAKEAKFLVVLDHHKTAERNLKDLSIDNCQIILDMERSGAQLAWDYLYPDSKRPYFVDYVADRDLWEFKLPNSKAISEALYFNDYFKDFEKLEGLYLSGHKNFDIDNLKKEGELLLRVKQKEIDYYVSQAKSATFTINDTLPTYNVYIVMCPRHLRSDVGNAIVTKEEYVKQGCDFAAMCWFNIPTSEWYISLRGNDRVDLSEVASHFHDGGGHKNAAGFTITKNSGESLSTYFSLNKTQ